ncbi:beta-1,3-galactosyltransferase 1-like [Eriocheir sinensis]|uniref:beta-1,3-galactosyltransferase 1-like n=1 Tax=Eriocheir sinensis TaxID=95602 RepID=UPI0021C8B741|nr:beta-1,3-galactosyltransferase 1-like [Eriocheir sinensis]
MAGRCSWGLSWIIIGTIFILSSRDCGGEGRNAKLHFVRSAYQELLKNNLTLNAEDDQAYDEEDEDSVDNYYDWYEDYYMKYKSFVRHALMSDVFHPQFIIENSRLCKANTKIIILFNSRLNNRSARDAVRDNFRKTFTNMGVAYGFFLSNPKEEPLRRRVLKESKVWGDIVIAATKEAYPLLTLKTAHLLHWVATNCPASAYVAKVDDDVYVNVDRLLRLLDTTRNYTVLGKVCTNCIPFRGLMGSLGAALRTSPSVVVTRRHVPLTKFPPFAMGPAYVLTTDLVPRLLEAALQMVYFEYEDVFWTGQVVDEINELGNAAGSLDPESIKDKYEGIGWSPYLVRHENVVNWRVDVRGPITSTFTSLAHQAFTVHGVNWHKHKQLVSDLMNVHE